MSYLNGLLETTSTKITEGTPGVGFKLTADSNYDMDGKKLTNVQDGHANRDVLNEKQITDLIAANGGSDKAVYLTTYFKKDGSDRMTELLNMNKRRIENVAPGRHNTSDALTHLQLESFYFDLNVDDGKIEAQNPIDKSNKKLVIYKILFTIKMELMNFMLIGLCF